MTVANPISLPIQSRSIECAEILRFFDGQGCPGPEEGKLEASAADWSAKHTSVGSASTTSRVSSNDEWSPDRWRVRNTFLDMPQRSALQSFQARRRAWSTPPARGGREAAEREELAAGCSSPDCSELGAEEEDLPIARVGADTATEAPRPLALADLVGPQSHSRGSELHFQGGCKPCAFFWKVVGCRFGSECEFCHLCGSEERKRRNKEKRIVMHVLQNQMVGRVYGAASVKHSRGSRFA